MAHGTPRIPLIDPAAATGKARTLLDGLKARGAPVSPMLRVLAQAPAALAAFLGFRTAMSAGVLPAALRERIAIATAVTNRCDMCLGVHTRFGREAGLSEAELMAARDGHSTEPAAQAALDFAAAALRSQGHVTDAEYAAVRAAGFDEAAILEIVATAYINAFTNAVNSVARTAEA